jgi:O-antigen/teichoic acid export membrane protein
MARAQRLIDTAKRSLPEGTFAVGLGLLVSGLTAYLFQILAFRALSKGDYTALNGLWVIAFVLAPGFFLPLEQEVGRALAHRRARGVGGGPVVRKAAIAGGLLCAGLIALSLITEFVARALGGKGLSGWFFHDRQILVPILAIALATYAFQMITRGTLAGNGRFRPYGVILAAEGIIRIVPVAVLYAAGVTDLVWYGLCFAVPPVIASLVALRGQHGLLAPGPDAPWSELSVNLSWLFGGSVMSQALSYSPIVGVLILANGKAQRDIAADFIVGFFIARIPILLFQAVQAALLPRLAALASANRIADFRAGVRKLIYIVVGIGVIGVVAGATLGATAGQILFGDKFKLDNGDLALLAAGSGLFIVALTLAQALIALLGHARAAWAWLVGNVVFVIVTAFVSHDLFLRVELGFVAGCAASAVAMALFLRAQMAAGIPADSLAHLVEQIETEPLEI